MKTSVLPKTAGLAALALVLGTLTLAAQRPGENRPQQPAAAPQIERIEREIERLKSEGRTEDARRMNQRLLRVREARKEMAGRPDAPRRTAGPRPAPDAKPRPEGPPPRVKIRNLRQAAALLEAAGYADHAARVRSEAERVETDARKMEPRRKAQTQRGKEMMREPAADEKAMRQPRPKPAAKPQPPAAKPGSPANPAMEAEVRKLRRELDEMRAEIRRMKAADPRPARD